MTAEPLDDPIGTALRTRHARFASRDGRALRYPGDVAPFGSIPRDATPDDWTALARLADGDSMALFVPTEFAVPADWATELDLALVQMTDDAVETSGERGADVVDLTVEDVPEMLRLTKLTRPGPFLPRTVEFGGYVGVFHDERLVAMAGRRLSVPGWVEVSAVCTDPAARGRGYARRLITEVVRGIRDDGDRAFLHVASGNRAQGVYEGMGFRVRNVAKVVDVRVRRG